MHTVGQLVVWEATGQWAARLRAALAPLFRAPLLQAPLLQAHLCQASANDAPEDGRRMPAESAVHRPRGRWLEECRSSAACLDALREAPASLVVVEVTPQSLDAAVSLTARVVRDYPLARLTVIAPRGLARWEWLLREAGAAAWFEAPRDLAPLVGMIQAHLSHSRRPGKSLWQEIIADLPWSVGDEQVS